MRFTRLFWFAVSILIGLLLGLYLGWQIKPLPYRDVTLSSLRSDYKTDYTLMVAETYSHEGDINKAAERLQALGYETPLQSAQHAVIKARELGYSSSDIALLVELVNALQSVAPISTPTLQGTT
ncbi:MAG: hypothetical protein HPY45_04790 [Anaerolineae bacterium]|nr:hypothetical protein [Anaerolineae bacterium]